MISVQIIFGQNLINNGSFEFGGSGYGFITDGLGYNLLNPPYSGLTAPGNYAIVNNPNTLNSQTFLISGDHTTGNGLMLVFDGNSTGNQERFWKAGNSGEGICDLTPGNSYSFSYWIRTITNSVSSEIELANINVSITNATNVTLEYGTTLAPLPNFNWLQVRYSFVATSNCVNFELFNENTGVVGNDFAIDDIELFEQKPLSFAFSTTQPNCSDENSGAIFLYLTGGVAPYTFRVIGSQGNIVTNSSGLFSNLSPGNYIVGLKDANGNIDSVNNVILDTQSPITIEPGDTLVCPNTVLSFTASNGESAYVWNSSPNDIDLITTNQPSISVSPNFSTSYTATSQANNINLIYNGDFELGNKGFLSHYQFRDTNYNSINRSYGVEINSSEWDSSLGNCIDHTFGNSSGKMLVVSGSTYNAGNDLLWSQKIAVEPNKTYDFSFWLQSLELNNPAEIQVLINGQLLTSNLAVNQTCVWNQYFSTWNSGLDTLAEIKLINKQFEDFGNSFSLDDLEFKTQNNCSASVTVSMKTENPDYGVVYPSNLCLNSGTSDPILDTNFVAGGIYNVVEPGLNIDNLSGQINLSNGTNIGSYHVTYTASVCGQFIPDTFLVNVRPLPNLIEFTGGNYLCDQASFEPLNLSVSGTANWTIYYLLDGQPQILDSAISSPISLGNSFGTYQLDSISDAYCSNEISGSQTISLLDAPSLPIISGKTEYCRNDFAEALFVANTSGIINWYLDSLLTNNVGSNNELLPTTQSTQTYYVTETVNGCEGPASSVVVKINDCDLIIPSAFTPNEDGENDTWNISELDELYPENVVFIYNRWGEPIFESLPGKYAQNPWDGKFKEGMMPVGTYYYVIQRSEDKSIEPLNGIVTLILKE
jgi:gliding motility-associated-like protein